MPWSVKTKAKGCDGFAVVKDGTNTPVPGGCHKTRPAALKHLLALRLSYGERANPDQPRDPDGKFASGGGGGSSSDGGGKGGGGTPKAPVAKPPQPTRPSSKAGSRMKPAPANVTSKGVNPDAEYVRSAKTGNVFKNPQYNGNPNGAGKYADNGKVNGRPKPIGGRIDEMEGGSKFQQTGQSKHKDDGAGPRTPSPRPQPAGVPKSSVGKTPPRYVKGKKLDPKDPETTKSLERIKASSRAGRSSGDPYLAGVAELQGFDGKPLVVTQAEAAQLQREGWTRVWRGTGEAPRGVSYSQDFAEGEYFPGLGVYGNGTYSSNRLGTAETYSGGNGLNEILISPDAVVVDAPEVYSRHSDFKNEITRDAVRADADYQRELKEASPTGLIKDIPGDVKDRITAKYNQTTAQIRAREEVLGNAGVFAASQGIDVFVVRGTGHFTTQQGVRTREDYFVILNRTAVATRVVRP